jgi:hypothetical protein
MKIKTTVLVLAILAAATLQAGAQTMYRLGTAHNGYQVWISEDVLHDVISSGEKFSDDLIAFLYSRPDRTLSLVKIEHNLHVMAASYNVNGATEQILFDTLYNTMVTRFSDRPQFIAWYNAHHIRPIIFDTDMFWDAAPSPEPPPHMIGSVDPHSGSDRFDFVWIQVSLTRHLFAMQPDKQPNERYLNNDV